MRMGLMNNPNRDPLDEIRRACDLGFGFIDLTIEPPRARAGDIDPDAVRRALSGCGLGIVGHTAFYLPIGSPFDRIAAAAEEELAAAIRALAACGAPTVAIHPQGKLDGLVGRDEIIARHVDSLERLGALAHGFGVRAILENVPHPIFNDPETLGALFEAVPGLGLLLDVAHAWLRGRSGLAALLGAFSERLAHVHASDNFGLRDDHTALGAGTIDWPCTVQMLKGAGFDGGITLEVCTDDDRYLALSRDKLREWWHGAGGRSSR
jgi:sugar phosphate isomerase/epimerase